MSKMNDIALQLDERAVELGFADHLEALGNGYEWGVKDNGEVFLVNPKEEQEKAHEAWLEEREEVFEMIDNMKKDIIDSVDKKEGHPRYWVDTLERIYTFIEKGEM